jgi:exodeoxyribonuclease VII small subunit
MAKDAKQKTESFEHLYASLEEKVAKLEAGGLTLDDAIALYEEGMTLARACQERLDEAELKITKLRESFAPIARNNGAMLKDAPSDEDYEYVTDDDPAEEPGDDFP